MVRPGVLLVRHGQSTWNADGRWQGQADAPLSTLGVEQARAGAVAVASLAPARVVSSDLARARDTAVLLAPAGCAVEVDPDWRERHAGEWEGLTRVEIEERFPGWIEAHRSPPGFERDEPLLARTRPALEALCRAHAEVVVLVVTHGGVIRTFERLLGAPSVPVPNVAGRWVHLRDGELVLGDREVLIDAEAITVPEQI